jgi:predicted amidophosphoribosyltransferase
MSNISAKCRYCGHKVQYFGDLCAECEATCDRDEYGDSIQNPTMSIINADLASMSERQGF